MRNSLSVAALCLLTGCMAQASKPVRIQAPKPVTQQPQQAAQEPQIIRVQVIKYVAVPKALTTPLLIEQFLGDSLEELQRVAMARGDSLERCNADKAKIRSIQGTTVTNPNGLQK